MSNGLTLAEWKEIEEFLKLTPRCKLDKTGIVWMHDEEGNTTGALHAHTFLDIMREEANGAFARAMETNRILDQKFKDAGASVLYQDELAVVESVESNLTVSGIRALVKQLIGKPHSLRKGARE